jgi:hypothetical protein
LAGGEIFLKNGKDIFLFDVLPSKYSGSVAGRNADSVKQNYFCGRKRICFASTLFCAGIWYPPRARAREECAADFDGLGYKKETSQSIQRFLK